MKKFKLLFKILILLKLLIINSTQNINSNEEGVFRMFSGNLRNSGKHL